MTTAWFSSAATFSKSTREKVTFLLLCQVDMVVTACAVSAGFIELNPFVALLLEFPLLFVLMKGLVPLLIAWAVPGKMLLPAAALSGIVFIWNMKELLSSVVST